MIPQKQFLKAAYLQLAHGQCHDTTFKNIGEGKNQLHKGRSFVLKNIKTRRCEKELTCLLALYQKQPKQIEHSAFQMQYHPERKTISI